METKETWVAAFTYLIREKNKTGRNNILSYLSARKQSFFFDGHLSSDISSFYCGVPQGSIGGPLFWLCFTCDQQDVIHDHPVDWQDLHHGCSHDVQGQEWPSQDVEPAALQEGVTGTVQEVKLT